MEAGLAEQLGMELGGNGGDGGHLVTDEANLTFFLIMSSSVSGSAAV